MAKGDLWERIAMIEKLLDSLEARSFVHYNKGTYAPVYQGATTPGVTTYTVQAGFWTRIGRVILFNGRITWTAATGTGSVQITLPFTTANITNLRFFVGVWIDNVTFANGSVEGQMGPNSIVFDIRSPITNGASTLVAVEAAGDIIFSGFYYIQ